MREARRGARLPAHSLAHAAAATAEFFIIYSNAQQYIVG